YSKSGQTQQRSEKMGTRSLGLDEETRKEEQLFEERYRDMEPEPGWKLRVVTFKASVPRSRFTSWPFDWGPLHIGPKLQPKGRKGDVKGGKGGGKGGKGGWPPGARMPPGEATYPVVFIQYGSDTSFMDQRLADLESDRQEQLAEQKTETEAALR